MSTVSANYANDLNVTPSVTAVNGDFGTVRPVWDLYVLKGDGSRVDVRENGSTYVIPGGTLTPGDSIMTDYRLAGLGAGNAANFQAVETFVPGATVAPGGGNTVTEAFGAELHTMQVDVV